MISYAWVNETGSDEDVAAINRLLKRGNVESPRIEANDIFRLIARGGLLLLARDSESRQVVGMARLVLVPMFIGKEGVMEDVAVLEGYERRGIASAMVRRLLARAREEGAVRVGLVARKENRAANAFYRAMGFEPLDVRSFRIRLA